MLGGRGCDTFKSYFLKFFLPQKLCNISALGHQSQILLSKLGVNFDWPTLDF